MDALILTLLTLLPRTGLALLARRQERTEDLPASGYDCGIFLAKDDDPEDSDGPDGLTIRNPEDISDRPEEIDIGPKAIAKARREMADAARHTDSQSDSKGLPDLSTFCAGPVQVTYTYTRHLVTRQEYWAAKDAGVEMPWWSYDCNVCNEGKYVDSPEGAKLAKYPALKTALGYRGKCNKCGDLLPLRRDVLVDELTVVSYQGADGRARCPQQGCEAVLDDSGHCPDCGYSTIWTEEHKAHAEHCAELDVLERKVAKSLINSVKAEQAERTRRLRFWFGAAPVERIKRDRAAWWKKVADSRRLAAETGLWHHAYMVKDQCNDIWGLTEQRLGGLPPVGRGAPEYTEPSEPVDPGKHTRFFKNLAEFEKAVKAEHSRWP